MRIDIQASDFSVTESMYRHTHARIQKNLRFCESRLISTAIHLSEVNGLKGGNDKCCLLKINRAGRTLCRRLSKRRNRERTTTIKYASMAHMSSGA